VKLPELIDNISNLPLKVQDQLLAYLVSAEITMLSESERFPLWTKLVNIVTKHRKYADAKWAMKTEDIDRIAAVAAQLAPLTLFYRHQRLFTERSFDLFEDTGDFAAQNKKLEEAREKAIYEIIKSDGISAVLEFVNYVESPWHVGIACGIVSTNEIDSIVLPNLIDNKDKSLIQFSGGFIVGKFRIQGWQWVDKIETKTWSPIQTGLFLTYLPFTSETWDRVSTFLGDNASMYWSKANANPYETKSHLEFAIEQLINHNRPIAAIRCLDGIRNQNQPLNIDLVVKSLDAVISTKERLTTTDQYAIVELIKVLQSDPNINPQDLIKIEWSYTPLLDYHNNASPKFLEQKLADEPRFFCEIIRKIYLSKREEPEKKDTTEQEKNIASNAYRLLAEWKIPPGFKKDGSYNGDALFTWLDAVKKECSETGHLEVAMMRTGYVLIHSPSDPDGLWIHLSTAEVLNAKDADKMREGFITALSNSRGVYFFSAGEEEKKLEKEYRIKADAVESRGYYRLADTLKILAASYRHDAERAAKGNPVDE
jgi:hypothetical protein